jgi:hypothetical protein
LGIRQARSLAPPQFAQRLTGHRQGRGDHQDGYDHPEDRDGDVPAIEVGMNTRNPTMTTIVAAHMTIMKIGTLSRSRWGRRTG